MIRKSILVTLAAVAFFSFNTYARDFVVVESSEDKDIVEVASESVFIPRVGYDDNDNVTLVLHGTLPNACFTIGNHVVERNQSGLEFRVRQFAVRRKDGACAQRDLPPHFSAVVPFTEEVKIGNLEEGEYLMHYWAQSRGEATKPFLIEKAPSLEQDTYPYAATSNVFVRDIAKVGDYTRVMISGVLTSSCQELPENIQVRKIDDIFVVLPVLNLRRNVMCTEAIRPFERVLELGRGEQGHYLVHVRSMNGKAISRVFEVVK